MTTPAEITPSSVPHGEMRGPAAASPDVELRPPAREGGNDSPTGPAPRGCSPRPALAHCGRHPAVPAGFRWPTCPFFSCCCGSRARGHDISLWIDDELGHMKDARPARIRRQIRDWFVPLEAPVYKGFDEWFGADVALATGWQTAHSGGDARRVSLPRVPLCRITSPSSTLLQPRPPGPNRPIGSASITSAAPRTSRRWSRGTAEPRAVFSFGIDHDVYKPSETDPAGAGHCRHVRTRRHAPTRCPARGHGDQRAARTPAADKSALFRQQEPNRDSLPLREPRDLELAGTCRDLLESDRWPCPFPDGTTR